MAHSAEIELVFYCVCMIYVIEYDSMEHAFQAAGSDFHNHALGLLMSDQQNIISFTGVKEQSASQLFPPNIINDFQTARGGK